jgi:hypothetical protein
VKPNDDDRIDADLRALFADQRLSLPVGQDAVGSVLVGAQRRRRRRTMAVAAGGALAVAAVLLAGGLVAGHLVRPDEVQIGSPGGGLATLSYSNTPTVSGSASQAPSGLGTAPGTQPGVLGPNGYGDLVLGMTAEQALATKMVNSHTRLANGCLSYTRQSADASHSAVVGSRPYTVYLSNDRWPLGIQAISAPPGTLTPEGIGIGSTEDALFAEYPNANHARDDVIVTAVPDHPAAEYRFGMDGKGTVTAIYLTVSGQTCLD